MTSLVPGEPNPSQFLGRGVTSLLQSLPLAIPKCEHRPRPNVFTTITPAETILPPQDMVQSPVAIREQSEEAYVASCTQSKRYGKQRSRSIIEYGTKIDQIAAETRRSLQELRSQYTTGPVSPGASGSVGTALHDSAIAVQDFAAASGANGNDNMASNFATAIKMLQIQSPAKAEEWRKYQAFSCDWTDDSLVITPKRPKLRSVSSLSRLNYVDGESCQPRKDKRKDSGTNEDVEQAENKDEDESSESDEASAGENDGFNDNRDDSSDGSDSPPHPPTSESKHLPSPQSLERIPESPQEESEENAPGRPDGEGETEQQEDHEENAASFAAADNESEPWTPTKRNVSLGAESTLTSASERVRRGQMKFSLRSGQKSASG